jgi:hypothetical protein
LMTHDNYGRGNRRKIFYRETVRKQESKKALTARKGTSCMRECGVPNTERGRKMAFSFRLAILVTSAHE